MSSSSPHRDVPESMVTYEPVLLKGKRIKRKHSTSPTQDNSPSKVKSMTHATLSSNANPPSKAKSSRKKTKLDSPNIAGDCPVCCAHFTTQLRAPVPCPAPGCDFAACKQCVMRYLSEDTYDEPHCMSCRKPWLDEFVMERLTQTFWFGPFKKHKERLVMDRERNLMPVTMPLVAAWKHLRAAKAAVDVADVEVWRWKRERAAFRKQWVNRGKRFPHCKEYRMAQNDRLRAMAERSECELTFNLMADDFLRGNHVLRGSAANAATTGTEESKESVGGLSGGEGGGGPTMQCPFGECRGFLDRLRRCGVCERWVCGKCHKEKAARSDPDHVCAKEDIATVEFIKRDAKPCPGCAAPIHKISGCYMMFCTSCKTAFDWKDLKILNPANVHNPHMIEWMRSGGGAGLAAHAGVRSQHGLFLRYIRTVERTVGLAKLIDLRVDLSLVLDKANQAVNEARDFVEHRREYRRFQRDLLIARLNYMCGFLAEEDWKKVVVVNQRELDRQRRKADLLEVFAAAMGQLLTCRIEEGPAPWVLLKEMQNVYTFFKTQAEHLKNQGLLTHTMYSQMLRMVRCVSIQSNMDRYIHMCGRLGLS